MSSAAGMPRRGKQGYPFSVVGCGAKGFVSPTRAVRGPPPEEAFAAAPSPTFLQGPLVFDALR